MVDFLGPYVIIAFVPETLGGLSMVVDMADGNGSSWGAYGFGMYCYRVK